MEICSFTIESFAPFLLISAQIGSNNVFSNISVLLPLTRMIKVNSELLINTLRAVFFLIENSENRSYLMLTFILIYAGLSIVIGAKGITIQLLNNDVSSQSM